MRFFLSGSLLIVLFGCSSVYKNLQPAQGNFASLQKFRPDFKVALYKAQINVTSNYLSGLLLIKTMPDSSTRLLFSNEMGFKFFDFEFSKHGEFKVHYILKKMDRKPVIATLRKDFEIVLMQHLDTSTAFIKRQGSLIYYGFPQVKGTNYYVTDASGNSLLKMERASRRKTVVTIIAENFVNNLPDTIGIEHHNFNFTIALKRIPR